MVKVTNLVPSGRRLMTPQDKAIADKKGANDWPDMSTATEVREYSNGLRVKYDRSLLKTTKHKFTVTAINADTGKLVGVCENAESYEEARKSIEASLRV